MRRASCALCSRTRVRREMQSPRRVESPRRVMAGITLTLCCPQGCNAPGWTRAAGPSGLAVSWAPELDQRVWQHAAQGHRPAVSWVCPRHATPPLAPASTRAQSKAQRQARRFLSLVQAHPSSPHAHTRAHPRFLGLTACCRWLRPQAKREISAEGLWQIPPGGLRRSRRAR